MKIPKLLICPFILFLFQNSLFSDNFFGWMITTTDVELTSFKAKYMNDRLVILWHTGIENGVIGFNIYGATNNNDFFLINDRIINSKGNYSFYSYVGDVSDVIEIKLQVVDYDNHSFFSEPLIVERSYTESLPISSTVLMREYGDSEGCSSSGNGNVFLILFIIIFVFKRLNRIG